MIANYTQLLAERYRGQLDEQADKYIGYAADGAIRMQALIHDLLKFSQLGKQEIELQPADCRIVVAQAVKNLQAAVQEGGAVVNWNGLPVVMADPAQLTQVFQNLIANFDRPPKLVLLDLKLPKVDGLEVVKQLKGDSRTKSIPVVIMTSSKEERDMVSGYNLGANSYIQKPVDFDQFRDTVKNVGLYWLVINQPPPVSGVRELDSSVALTSD
jgi:CheY-like chemotaxis protein